MSPFSSLSRASTSLGRMTPTELPIWVSLSAVMADSDDVITNVILTRLRPRRNSNRPPGARAMLIVNKLVAQGRGLAPVLLKRATSVELDWDVRQKSRFDAVDSS